MAVQTSLTDLSCLGRRPEMQDTGVQCNMISSIDTTPLTTSSSQTNDNDFKYPIEANVTQIRIEGSDSSSIPSSYDHDKTLTQSGLSEFPPLIEKEKHFDLNQKAENRLPLMEKNEGQIFHNRSRRNALVVKTVEILEHEDEEKEIELKSHQYYNDLAISNPSS